MEVDDLVPPRAPIDLTNCDREPIHVPGSIQPHGALLTATLPDLRIAQASANTGDVLGVAHGALLGTRLGELLDPGASAALGDAASAVPLDRGLYLATRVGERAFDAIVHRSSGVLVVELEPAVDADDASMTTLFDQARDAIERLQDAPRLAELWSGVLEAVRALTGFDRVMAYRFAEGGAGEVIAEARSEGVESFLGLRYPASDIPRQARALYLRTRVRYIVDAGYAPVPIVPPESPATGAPLDLGRSALRSVSPIHCRYLANMGVAASMSISLVHEERLWGLVACHHLTPRFVPYRLRVLATLLGDFVSWLLGPKLEAEHMSASVEAAKVHVRLAQRMSASPDLAAALVAPDPSALDLVDAGGFAVARGGAVATAGATPDPQALHALLAWLRVTVEGPIYATDALAAVYPPATGLQDTASGLLATVVSTAHDLMLIWFRPEAAREVHWAGDPHNPVDIVAGELAPRRSFGLWKEAVRGRSLPWKAWETEAASELRISAAGALLQHEAAEILSMNVDLKRAVQSRDDLVSMASHELRTPITTLTLQMASLRRLAEADRLSRLEALTRLEKAAAQVGRIERLVDILLDVARISAGRLEISREPCDLTQLCREVVERLEGAPIALTAAGDTSGLWDRDRLDQVLTNLLTNAIKYGAGKPVEVDLRGDPDRVILAVRDHGIGISADAVARIFERFERAVSPTHFAGFGLGLWIVRRIVEEHGGEISVESIPGQGSTFTVELRR